MAKRDYTSLVGERFGRWVVVDVVREGNYVKAVCNCDCGTQGKLVRVNTLESGESGSCGCLASEMMRERSTTHGYSRHPLYQAHYDMLRRCYDSSRKDYPHYGGRGIVVCEDWKEPGGKGFENFLQDSKHFTGNGGEIDRRDVNGNYCPENCKWATRKEQTRNTRFNNVIEYEGESLCMAEWAERLNIPYRMLQDRLGKLGWSVHKAFTHKMRPKHVYIFNGEQRFELKDVFNAPPNHFYRARTLGIPVYQYVANLFKGIFSVKILVAGELHVIKPDNVDVGVVNLNLTEMFTKYCEDNKIVLQKDGSVA